MWDDIPEEVHWHLRAELQLTEHNHRRLFWELDCLAAALEKISTPFVLLKGAAYLLANLPTARGRVSSDIDLLVPESAIAEVEAQLRQAGWIQKEMSPRDANYFRRWLHEVPPMHHHYRGVELDLHHTILPRTDTLRVAPQKLLDQSIPATSNSMFHVLSPPDMVLHAATHLFRNGNFECGLRDLLDIDTLISHFAASPNYWDQLLNRAVELNLQIPCGLALRYCSRYLETAIPATVQSTLDDFQPNRLFVRLFDRIMPAALLPQRLDGDDRRRSRALWIMAHYPLPRLRAMLTPLFWIKRLPTQVG